MPIITEAHREKLNKARKLYAQKPALSHTVRTRDGNTITIKNYTRGKADRLQCTECMGFMAEDVKGCTDPLCPHFPFRRGTRMAYGNAVDLPEETVEKLDTANDDNECLA